MIKKIVNMRKFFFVIDFWNKIQKVGKYFIKEVYKFLLGVYVKVYQKSIICGNKVSLRIVFIIWLVLNGKMFINDKVVIWDVVLDQICVLCLEKNEIISYLFFDCKYIKEVWNVFL